MPLPSLYWIELKNTPIFEQLQLEEELLRTRKESFVLVNLGSPEAIVMGISGKPADLIDLQKLQKRPVPVLQRFSGGGTVFVDENTLFITFLFSKRDLLIPSFPESILRWSIELYTSAWSISGFCLKENDYCIQEKKCGGNAQYIQKERWLHHSSFLWDYSKEKMEYLQLPAKRPLYRKDRPHEQFLTRLKSHAPSPSVLLEQLKMRLQQDFSLLHFSLEKENRIAHRKSTQILSL